jgi:splicing factor 3A subunit 1
MEKIEAGEELEDTSQEKEKVDGVEETPLIPEDLGVEPPQPQFAMDMPNVSPIDLCVACYVSQECD